MPKKRTVIVEGKTYPSRAAACLAYGVLPQTLAYHVNKKGRDVEEVLLTYKGSYQQEKVSEKACRTCSRVLPADQFYVAAGRRDGLGNQCRRCSIARIETNTYGMTRSEVIERFGPDCWLCGGTIDYDTSAPRSSKSPVIEHCHATGKVRGMAHGQCNKIWGLSGEDADLLRRIAGQVVL